jgi:glycosyltransferase involved in cell wall biosynthesis
MTLAVVSSHPIQYHAPVYRALQTEFGVPVTAIYGSDFSVTGYHDHEFGVEFAWDTDLLSGYDSVFLSQVASGGARSVEEITTAGLGRALQQSQSKAVLLIGYSLPLYRAAFWHAQRLRLPVLFRAEVTDHARARSTLKHIARDQALRLFYQRCATLLYIGRRAHEHYQRLGCPDHKLFFSPYCIDNTPFQTDEAARQRLRSATRAQLNLDNTKRVLLFCGKLSERKGPDLLVNAIKQWPDELRMKTALVFVGDGEMRSALQSMASSSPVVEVRFLGFQNQHELSQYYHASDLLVLPSRQGETWGLVVNEALHHGIPAVVSDAVGCAPDLIQEGVTGEVFQTDRVDDLASALARTMESPNDEARRVQCRQQVDKYTMTRAAEGIARAYTHVMQRADRGHP